MISNSITSLRIVLLIPLYLLMTLGREATAAWWGLAVFLLAGFTDVIDGAVARKLGEVSRAGAMLDLISDRLLSLVVAVALLVNGGLTGIGALAALVLVARDVVVAALNETLPGRLNIRVTPLERVKISLQIVGFALLIAPEIHSGGPIASRMLGVWSLTSAAVLAGVTVIGYSKSAARALRPEN